MPGYFFAVSVKDVGCDTADIIILLSLLLLLMLLLLLLLAGNADSLTLSLEMKRK